MIQSPTFTTDFHFTVQ